MSNAGGAAHNATIRVTYEWYCPACGVEAVVDHWTPNRFHTCPKMRNILTVPMLRKGKAGKLVLNEREDYVGKEVVQLDPERGRPVMSIVTVRDDGQDTVVFAPTATASLRGD